MNAFRPIGMRHCIQRGLYCVMGDLICHCLGVESQQKKESQEMSLLLSIRNKSDMQLLSVICIIGMCIFVSGCGIAVKPTAWNTQAESSISEDVRELAAIQEVLVNRGVWLGFQATWPTKMAKVQEGLSETELNDVMEWINLVVREKWITPELSEELMLAKGLITRDGRIEDAVLVRYETADEVIRITDFPGNVTLTVRPLKQQKVVSREARMEYVYTHAEKFLRTIALAIPPLPGKEKWRCSQSSGSPELTFGFWRTSGGWKRNDEGRLISTTLLAAVDPSTYRFGDEFKRTPKCVYVTTDGNFVIFEVEKNRFRPWVFGVLETSKKKEGSLVR